MMRIAWICAMAGKESLSVEFFLTSLIIVATPGTGVLYTLAAGLSRGSRASVIAAFGCTLGIIPHLAAAIMGVAALLHASALAFQTLKYPWRGLPALYGLEHVAGAGRAEGRKPMSMPESAREVIVSAILVNILNPKLSIFFLAFLPQFVSTTDPHALSRMLGLSGVFMLLTFVIFAGYGLFAAAMRHQVLSRPRVMTWLRRRLRPSAPDWPWPTVDGSQTRSLLRPKERGSGLARHSLSPLQ